MSCSTSRATRSFLSSVRALQPLDRSQSESVYHAALRKTKPAATDPTQDQWNALVDRQITILALDRRIPEAEYERVTALLRAAQQEPPPDPRVYAALTDLPGRAQKAVSAVRRQVSAAAALRGVHPVDAGERYVAFRDQYLREFTGLPADQRPDPPEAWVRGYTTKDMMAVSSPADRATLYAMYRVQADPDAFGSSGRYARYASIDLETAGPDGKDGFKPVNGSIIEVAIIEYDNNENETGRYSQLVRPDPQVAALCGTGAQHIHGITPDDVKDAPSWEKTAPEVTSRLKGRIMLAQNARYERDWLSHHQRAAGQPFERYGPTVDTMTIAKQHLPDLPNYRLQTISEEVGVPYTAGHRAEHDTLAAGASFFALRRRIHTEWASSSVRVKCPAPPSGAGRRSRADAPPEAYTVTACDHDPVTVPDAWTSTPAGVPAGAA